MSIYKKLQEIQGKLEVPKGQYNSFGDYYYRSCEDILKAVKPLCNKNGCVLILEDELVQVGERYYVKAIATLVDSSDNNNGSVKASAYAREALEKKKMDDTQITGSASSYARKYALNGLFCIDDVKDADHSNGKASNDLKNGSSVTYETAKETFDDISPEEVEQIEKQQPPVDSGDKTDIVRSECEVCGKSMTKSQVELSTHKFGRALCPEHQKEAS